MFCNKCGKEIPDNTMFCTFCGERNQNAINSLEYNGVSDSVKKLFIVINSIISIIIVIGFVHTSLQWFESNREAFDWCNSSSKFLGNFLHWGICVCFCYQSITFICQSRKNMSTVLSTRFGVTLIMEGVILKILSVVYNDWTNSDMSIVMFRIFGRTYCNMVGLTIFMGVLFIISGIIMHIKEKQ